MLGALSGKIKDLDMFGHVINLNFERKGGSHKTIIGGLASIVVLVIYSYYIGLNLKTMFSHENDSI